VKLFPERVQFHLRASVPATEPAALPDRKEQVMQQYTIINDSALNLRFTGEIIATAVSSPEILDSNYSRSSGRWIELTLYRTKGGKYVCHERGCTQFKGEHERNRAIVCETQDGVIDVFGAGWLAKELYKDAGIDCAIEVE
jgi:hypothetical protein